MSPAEKRDELWTLARQQETCDPFSAVRQLVRIERTLPQSFQGPNTDWNMIKCLHPYIHPKPSRSLRTEEAVRISSNVMISKSENKIRSE